MSPSNALYCAASAESLFAGKSGKIRFESRSSGEVLCSRDHEEIATFLEREPDPYVDLVTSTGEAIGLSLNGTLPLRSRHPNLTDDGSAVYLFQDDVSFPSLVQGVHRAALSDLNEAITREKFSLDMINSHCAKAIEPFRLAAGIGRRTKQGRWTSETTSFQEFFARLHHHKVGAKDGACFLQGACVNGTRKSTAMIANHVIALDFDSGLPIEPVKEAIEDACLEALIYTTHSHLSDTSRISQHQFLRWSKGAQPTPDNLGQYLVEKKKLRPEVVEGLHLVDDAKHTEDGVMIVVRHQPVPKFRAVFPLSKAFEFAKRGGLQKDAIAEWKQRYVAFAASLGVEVDEACCDPARLFYFPRHEPGSEHGVWWYTGSPVDLDRYERKKSRNNRNWAADAEGVSGSGSNIDCRGLEENAEGLAGDTFRSSSDLEKRHEGINQSMISPDAARDLEGRDSEEAKHLRELNERCALVTFGGKLRVLYEPVTASEELRLISVQDARTKEAPRNYFREKMGGKGAEKVVPFNLWIDWPFRREYDDIVFHPGLTDPRKYNRFRGWAVEPAEGDWSILRSHLQDVVCGGDAALFDWVLTWLAHLFQRPGDKPGSALVIRGSKGCGKSIVFDLLAKLLGTSFSKAADTRRLTGSFNAALDHNLLFLLEESHWSGDKSHEGILKDLITSPHLMIERKGIDSQLKANFTRLAILSNERWIIPATADERRYAILDCRDDRRGDHAYFAAMVRQMVDEGGLAAMLHDLLSFVPGNGWDILRQPPQTEGLVEQIEESLQGVELFMFELLKYGMFESVDCDENSIELHSDRPTRIPARVMRGAIDEFLKNHDAGRRRKPGYDVIDRAMRDWTGGTSEMEDCAGMQNRTRYLVLPPLAEARSFASSRQGVSFEDR